MQIGSKPSQSVYQAKRGGDRFLVLDRQDMTVHLYVTVETLLPQHASTFKQYADKPYFWVQESGMLFVLQEVQSKSYEDAFVPGNAENILAEMEEHVEQL